MANWYEPTPKQIAAFDEWLATRPPAVAELGRHFPPWKLFRLKTSGHRCVPRSFDEHDDGSLTMTVTVDGQFNFVAFSRNVLASSRMILRNATCRRRMKYLAIFLR